MTELWFNNIKLDLGKAKISETRQINSFLELRDRQSSFTNKFKLPETPTNRLAMDMFGTPGASPDIPYLINNVSVYRNGVPTIEAAKGVVKKRTFGRGYDLNLQFGNNSIFDEISNKDLSDLDFSSLNHVSDINTIFNSYTNTWSEGYVYSVANFGFVNLSNGGIPLESQYQMPSVFIKWIFNKIFEEAGFTYQYVGDNNIFESTDFESRLITIDNPEPIFFSSNIDFNNLFSTVSQKSFLKAVFQDFGLMFQRKDASQNYEFIGINDYIENNNDAIDLSDKLNKIISVDATLKGYSKVNYMRYEYDNSEDDFSDGSFTVANELISEEKNLFNSPFKAPRLSSVEINGINVYECEFFVPTLNQDGTVKEIKSKKGKPYIHTLNYRNARISFNYENGFFNQRIGQTPFMDFSGMIYSEIISSYYSRFVSNLQKPELWVVNMALNAIDVLQFDFLKQVYIRQLGSFFYMNKISNFIPGKVTKCELVKINVTEKLGAYSDAYSNAYDI